jgi:hypothetical protein
MMRTNRQSPGPNTFPGTIDWASIRLEAVASFALYTGVRIRHGGGTKEPSERTCTSARAPQRASRHPPDPACALRFGRRRGVYPGSVSRVRAANAEGAMCTVSALQRVAKRGPEGWPLATGWRLAQRAPKPEPRLGDNNTDSPEALQMMMSQRGFR